MRDALKKQALKFENLFLSFFFFTKICKNLAIISLTRFVENVSGTSHAFKLPIFILLSFELTFY